MRQIPLLPTCFLLLVACLPVRTLAQPSGGPYGPVTQTYSLPEAERIFYVAPNGRPDASGSNLNQPTTLATAIAKARTGDAIVLHGGLYRTGNLRFNQGITLQPYADEKPVLAGTRLATNWEALPDGRWRTRWTRLFPAAPADWWRPQRHLDETPLHRFNYDMVFLDGRRLLSAGGLDELSAESYYIDYPEGYVYLATDPAGHAVEITAHDSALVRTIRRVNGVDNDRRGPTIRGLTFTRYARLAVLVEGVEPGRPMNPSEFGKEVVGTTLEHLTISHCTRVAGYFRGDGLVMRHCLVSDMGTEGIYVINSSNVILERNIVTRTNTRPYYAGYYASAIKIFNQSHDVVVRDNLVIDNPNASGIWYDVGNVDGVVVNNWVERTNDGFFFEISKGATVAGNVFVDCHPGARVLNSSGVSLYQNTFHNSALWVQRDERSAQTGDHFGWHTLAGPPVEARDGHRAHNNLFHFDDSIEEGDLGAFVQVWQSEDSAERSRGPQLAALDGNVYVGRAPDTALVTWRQGSWRVPGAPVRTLEAPDVGEPPLELHGAAFLGFEGPVFRSATLKRFSLNPGFTLKNTGIHLPVEVLQLLLWPESTQPFPGAYPPENSRRAE